MALLVIFVVLTWRAMAGSQTGQSFFALGPVVNPLRHAFIAGAAIAVTLGIYFGINYAKFRTFDAVPLQYYDFYSEFPKRLKATDG